MAWWQRGWLVGLLLAALLLAGYGDLALGADYVHDDAAAVTQNPLVTWPPDLHAIFAGRYFGPVARFDVFPARPLTTLSFALEAGLGWTASWMRHAVQLLLWWATAWLSWRLLARWLTAAGVPARRSAAVALAAAALGAVHPIHTEAVMQVAFRPEVLGLLCGLLGTQALLALRLGGRPARHMPALLLWTAGALLAKESAVSLLAVWGCWAVCSPRARATLLQPLLAVLGVFALWLVWRVWNYGDLRKIRVPLHDNPLAHVDAPTRLFSGLELTARAFGRLLLPLGLAPDYTFDAWPPVRGLTPLALAGLVVLAVLAAATVWAARRLRHVPPIAHDGVEGAAPAAPTLGREGVLLLPLGALAMWLPVSQLLTPSTVLYGDRLMAGPAWLGATAWALVGLRGQLRGWGLASAALLVIAIGLTRAEAAHWTSPLRLFSHGVAVQPRSLRMQHNLAHAWVVAGQPRRAVPAAMTALQLDPADPEVWATAFDATLGARDCPRAAEVAAAMQGSPRPARAARLAAIRWGLQCDRAGEAHALARQLPADALQGRTLLDLYVLATASRLPEQAKGWAQRAGVDADADPLWRSAAAFGHVRGGRPLQAITLLRDTRGKGAAAAEAQARAIAKNLRDPAIRATIEAAWPALAGDPTATGALQPRGGHEGN